MYSLIEQIKNGKIWRYFGGVHPVENKTQSTQTKISAVSLPPHLIIPVKQHIGSIGDILVNVGDYVYKGQALTSSDSLMTVPVHAPTSGHIDKIAKFPSTHPSSFPELAIKIISDQKDAVQPERLAPLNFEALSTPELQQHISQSGIAGMGGAGFPTAVKINDRQPIEFLLINAAECEPYITSDDSLMREHAADIIKGIQILQHMISPEICIIGIEDNKPEAAAALNIAIEEAEQTSKILVRQVPTKYPNGGEKQLIKVLTGKEIQKGQIPAHSGIVMQNVGTVYAIKQAVVDRQPLIERIVTLTGDSFPAPCNVRALIGTPISHLLQEFNCQEQHAAALIYGGPMMGFTLPHHEFALTKTGNCILVPVENEIPQLREPDACIRCGECAEVCPMDLLPQQLHWYSQSKDMDKLSDYNLMDCIECGACSYVCPSQIPLVHQYRIAKVELRENDASVKAALVAKEKFEKRNARLDAEKAIREQRQQEAAAKRRETAKATTGEDPVKAAMERLKKAKAAESDTSNKANAVADAIARAKASNAAEPDNADVIAQREARKAKARASKEQKQEMAESTSSVSSDDKKASVAAAIARAKAKKAQAAKPSDDTADKTESAPAATVDDKKAAVAAAIARAKAKKAQSAKPSDDTADKAESAPAATVDDKKAAVAAAIARAKAKKAQAAMQSSDTADQAESAPAATVDDKKAAVAAAIARAKAKKAQATKQSSDTADNAESAPATSVDDKKAAVAAAIARAKAKKAQAAKPSDDTADKAESAPPATVDDKKAAVAAAIARAKAKKAQAAMQAEAASTTTESSLVETDDQQPVNDKKAAIAAAIAKAKAKKLAQSGKA